MRSRLFAAATIAMLAAGAANASGYQARDAAVQQITGKGVGKVERGMTHAELRAQGLVGPIKPGCELAGGAARTARLKPPLKGLVNYSLTNPRKVTDITIEGGNAKARGVGIGATIAQIKAKFPQARVFHGTEELFRATTVFVPKKAGGKIRFLVSVVTGRTELIGVPFVAFCE